MRSSRLVVRSPDFSVRVVHCSADHRSWSRPEQSDEPGIVLPHRGMFRVLSDGRRLTVDPTRGFLQVPGREQRFAHPAGGDVCTFITVREPLWHELAGPAPSAAVAVDGRLELAHRLLLRSPGDAADPVERLVHTVGAALRPDRPPPSPGRAELAERAREAVLADDHAATDLVSLARALGVSPSHLSRTFRRHTGMTLSRYRNRVRASRALARLEQGATDLAALAHDLGFTDQPHLTRTLTLELGHPPGHLRRLFASALEPSAG